MNKQAIRNIAVVLGAAALSVDDIAQQAGISRGLLFHYFSSKQEFHLEVARAAAQELLRRTMPDQSKPPLEALHESLSISLHEAIRMRNGQAPVHPVPELAPSRDMQPRPG